VAARKKHGDSLAALMNDAPAWKPLVRDVAAVVRVMPVWKLQTIGQERLNFLYAKHRDGKTIILRPRVAYCFSKFHPLTADLVRGAWARYVRQQNLKLVGEITDLNEFFFRSSTLEQPESSLVVKRDFHDRYRLLDWPKFRMGKIRLERPAGGERCGTLRWIPDSAFVLPRGKEISL
jgi:hypothetical protein